MTNQPPFDLEKAHRFFSTECFNQAWDLIEKEDRSAEENESMRMLAHAALWHWSQRPDCSDKNISVGYWQLSRVYALLGHAADAYSYARLSLASAERGSLDPFYFGYAFEALARSALTAGDRAECESYVIHAKNYAEIVADPEDRRLLVADLNSLSK